METSIKTAFKEISCFGLMYGATTVVVISSFKTSDEITTTKERKEIKENICYRRYKRSGGCRLKVDLFETNLSISDAYDTQEASPHRQPNFSSNACRYQEL